MACGSEVLHTKYTYLYFKVIVIEELLVHSVGIGIDGSQEHSNGERQAATFCIKRCQTSSKCSNVAVLLQMYNIRITLLFSFRMNI